MQQPDRGQCTDRQLREDRHGDERPVGVRGPELQQIDGTRVRRQHLRQRDPCRRDALIGDREAALGHLCGDRGFPVGDVDDFDLNRTGWTGRHTRRRLSLSQPAVAQIALADDAALGVVLRHAVRTVPGAVLTADAGIGAMQHDPGGRVLLECVHRAAAHAGRFHAMVAAHRQVRSVCVREPAAFDLPDPAPVDRRRVAVLLVAGDHTALAADALAHVEVKTVLLARTGRTGRHARCDRPQRIGGTRRGDHEGHATFRGACEQGQRQRHRHVSLPNEQAVFRPESGEFRPETHDWAQNTRLRCCC